PAAGDYLAARLFAQHRCRGWSTVVATLGPGSAADLLVPSLDPLRDVLPDMLVRRHTGFIPPHQPIGDSGIRFSFLVYDPVVHFLSKAGLRTGSECGIYEVPCKVGGAGDL